MTEREQADRLARVIDDAVHGHSLPDDRPEGIDDAELDALMRVARVRLNTARASAQVGLQHEGVVWQKLLSRLNAGTEPEISPNPFGLTDEETAEGSAVADEGFQEIIRLRRQMSLHIAAVAELHRDDIWQRVETRLEGREERHGILAFLRRRFAPSDGSLAAGDGLLEVARVRRALASAAHEASAEPRDRVWNRVHTRIIQHASEPAKQLEPAQPPRLSGMWPRLAAMGAAAAIVVAALGPVPATGLAGHPAADFVRLVGERVGITETASPPPAVTAGAPVDGVGMTAAEASRIMNIPVVEPTHLPPGFEQTISTYFPDAITATTGGVFARIYTAATGSLAIYQEAASGYGLAVQPGTATDVVITTGLSGTYFEGHWQPTGWVDSGTQTLVFERDGVHITIQYTGPAIDTRELVDVAVAMAHTG